MSKSSLSSESNSSALWESGPTSYSVVFKRKLLCQAPSIALGAYAHVLGVLQLQCPLFRGSKPFLMRTVVRRKCPLFGVKRCSLFEG